jgi:hypothetical protein
MPSFKEWINPASGATGPAIGAQAVTPNDSADLPFSPARAIYVGVGGDISVVFEPGSAAVTYSNLPAGFKIYGFVTRVRSTGTSATNIVAEY